MKGTYSIIRLIYEPLTNNQDYYDLNSSVNIIVTLNDNSVLNSGGNILGTNNLYFDLSFSKLIVNTVTIKFTWVSGVFYGPILFILQ